MNCVTLKETSNIKWFNVMNIADSQTKYEKIRYTTRNSCQRRFFFQNTHDYKNTKVTENFMMTLTI